MSSQFDPNAQWEQVARELRACKEAQQKAWGHIDSSTIGRYLAGETSSAERAEVEAALDELPELRKLTDLVRDVLADLEPVAFDSPQPATVRTFPRQPALSPARRFTRFLRHRSSLLAAACLLLMFSLAMPRTGLLPQSGDKPRLGDGFAGLRPIPRSARPAAVTEPAVALRGQLRDPIDDQLPIAPKHEPIQRRSEANNPRHAAELNRLALDYSARGDLVKAVPLQTRAHQMCRDNLGPDHPATQKTARSLADAYQAALNSPSANPYPTGMGGGGARVVQATGGYALPGGPAKGKDKVPEQGALALRAQIVERTTQEVQTSVVPVLAEALRTEPDTTRRLNIVRAIASLGPAGGNAVGALTDRLKASNDPTEVRVVLEALAVLGPAATQAAPALQLLSERCSTAAEEKKVPRGAKFTTYRAKDEPLQLSVAEHQRIRQALARLKSPQGRAGVEDTAGCFSVRAVCRANRTLRELARKSRIEIVVSTLPCRTTDGKECCEEETSDRRFAGGKRAIHIIFVRDGAGVEVLVSDSLRRAGYAEKIRAALQKRLRQHDYDKALDESIRFVSEIARAK